MSVSIKGASKPLLILGVSAAVLAGIGSYAWYESRRPAIFELYVFDTPGSPSVFIRTPNDRRILIDGGAGVDIVERLTGILPFYSRHIDILIATKPDAKNVTGLIEVLNRYQADRIVVPAITLESLGLASSTDAAYQIFLEDAKTAGVTVEADSAGMRLVLDQGVPGSTSPISTAADILFPVLAGGFKYSKASSPEIVMRINYGSASILLIADASLKTQKFISASNLEHISALIAYIKADPADLSSDLIRSLTPGYLVYSQTLSKSPRQSQKDPLIGILKDRRFNIKDTGVVKITSDGTSLKVENEK